MNRWMRIGALGMVAGLLVACGGSGGDSDDRVVPWGAIAVNHKTGMAAIVANHENGAFASTAARDRCGVGNADCQVVLTFSGWGNCGAIAADQNGVIGLGEGKPLSVAQQNAINSCSASGGQGCGIPSGLPGLCND